MYIALLNDVSLLRITLLYNMNVVLDLIVVYSIVAFTDDIIHLIVHLIFVYNDVNCLRYSSNLFGLIFHSLPVFFFRYATY